MIGRASIPVFIMLMAACGNDGGPPAPDDDDSLDIGCWNLRMFQDATLAPRIASLISALNDIDIMTFEEIESAAALEDIASELGSEWQSSLQTGGIGVVWDQRAVLVPTIEQAIAATGASPRPVHHLTVQLLGTDGETTATLDLYAVHFKAGTSASDEQARIDNAIALEANVRTAGPTALVLGDFNADFDDARGPEVFAPWTSDRYTVLTRPLDDDGGITYLPAGIMLDHVVATNALTDVIVAGPYIPDIASEPDFDTLSDHLPVVVAFDRARIE